jgi:hypothetical protein
MQVAGVTEIALVGLGSSASDSQLTIRATEDDQPLAMRRETVEGRERWSAKLRKTTRVIQIEYRVQLDRREGEPHMGFSSRRIGHLGEDYQLLPGREVFLVPEPSAIVGSVRVSFRGAEGHASIVGPWPVTHRVARSRASGRTAVEDLVAGQWLVGELSQKILALDRGTARITWVSSWQANKRLLDETKLRTGLNAVQMLLGVPGQPEYQLLLLPNPADGPIDVGSAWSTGQVLPGMPLTDDGLEGLLANYAGSFVRFSRRQLELDDPVDYWFVDGLERWAALRGTYRATGRPDDEFRLDLSKQLLHLASAGGNDLNLEHLYSNGVPPDPLAHILAPAGVEELSIRLARSTGDSMALPRWLGRGIMARRSTQPWTELEASLGRAGAESLHATIRWKAPYELLARANIGPMEEIMPSARWDALDGGAMIIASGDLEGYLENCGCKSTQAGGMARRASALAALRNRASHALLLDAGSFMAQPEKSGDVDEPTVLEQDLFLSLMGTLRYDAVAPGSTEFSSDPARLKIAQQHGIPLVCANVRRDGQLLCPPFVVRPLGSLRVGILGLFEPPSPQHRTPSLDRRLSVLSVEPPLTAYSRYLGELARASDVVVVLGSISPSLVRAFAQLTTPPDLIVSRDYQAVVSTHEGLRRQDQSGRIRDTWVIYTRSSRYGVDFAKLGDLRQPRLKVDAAGSRRLDSSVPDQIAIRQRLNAFYANIKRMTAISATVAPLDLKDQAATRGGYAGANACRGCHQAEYEQWKGTPHATAFKTLLDVHRNYQPRCVVCHVVGFGTTFGYQLGAPTEELANVQCESCHGSGRAHLADPARSPMRRSVPATVCLSCHTPEHSEAFIYSERVKQVTHDLLSGHGVAAQ